MRHRERVERRCVVGDPPDRREARRVDREPVSVEHLRHDADIGERRRVAEAQLAGARIVREARLERCETGLDPVPVPCVLRFLGHLQRVLQVLQHAQVVQRMDLACDLQRNRPHIRAVERLRRQQRGFGMRFLEIFDDRERLLQRGVAVDQRRHDRIRIHRAVCVLQLLAAVAQHVHRDGFVRQLLQVQGDPHAVRRGTAEIAVELHGMSLLVVFGPHRYARHARGTAGNQSLARHAASARTAVRLGEPRPCDTRGIPYRSPRGPMPAARPTFR